MGGRCAQATIERFTGEGAHTERFTGTGGRALAMDVDEEDELSAAAALCCAEDGVEGRGEGLARYAHLSFSHLLFLLQLCAQRSTPSIDHGLPQNGLGSEQ